MFRISEDMLDNYLKFGYLDNQLVGNVKVIKCKIGFGTLALSDLSEKEIKVFNGILSDLNEIELMLRSIQGNPDKSACPYNEVVTEEHGYSFKRYDAYGQHIIAIEKGNFYWNIGLTYDGKFWELGNDVNINGYCHKSTNGSLNMLKMALEHTVKYFPKIHFPKYEMGDLEQNYLPLCSLIGKLLNRPDIAENGMSGKGETRSDSTEVHHFHHRAITNEMAEKLIVSLRKILPSLTVEKSSHKNSFGITLVDSEIPLLLTAADKPEKEIKAANKANATPDSLKWLAAKSIWKQLPKEQVEQFQNNFEDLSYLLHKAKRFS